MNLLASKYRRNDSCDTIHNYHLKMLHVVIIIIILFFTIKKNWYFATACCEITSFLLHSLSVTLYNPLRPLNWSLRFVIYILSQLNYTCTLIYLRTHLWMTPPLTSFLWLKYITEDLKRTPMPSVTNLFPVHFDFICDILLNPLTLKIWLLILPSSFNLFLCKLVMRIWW